MKNFLLAYNVFLKSAEHPTVCFFGRNEAVFIDFFSNGTLPDMENFPWQLNDWKIFLGKLFAIGKKSCYISRIVQTAADIEK